MGVKSAFLTEMPPSPQGGGSRGRGGGGYYHSNPHYDQYYQNKYSRDRDAPRGGGDRRGGYDGGGGSRDNDFRLGRNILGEIDDVFTRVVVQCLQDPLRRSNGARIRRRGIEVGAY